LESELLACGYSFHTKAFTTSFISGLPTFLFRLQTEGSCHALVNEKKRKIEAGDLLLYQPGDAYELQVDGDEESGKISSGDYFLFCEGTWIRQWWDRSAKPTCIRIDLDERILSLWRQLYLEKHKVEEVDPELISYLLRALCLSLERATVGIDSLRGHSTVHAKFTGNRMKRYIEDHATATFKTEDVANHVGLSVSRAVHIFKDCFGFTMIQFALEIRLSNVIERMNYSYLNLEQIAEGCGFGSYAYFHKVFKGKYGITPKEFRLKATQQSELKKT